MFAHTRRWVGFAVVAAGSLLPRVASAQYAQFDACTAAEVFCARIRLTSLGASGGLNVFQLALNNLGASPSVGFPSGIPTAIFALTLNTSTPHVAPGDELVVDKTPTAFGAGASVVPGSPDWTIIETGDQIALFAPANDGIGSCVAGGPVGGVGQMATTCGADAFVGFTFSTSRSFDLYSITLDDLEITGVVDGLPSDSINDFTPGTTSPLVVTPEPATMTLALTGLAAIAGIRRRRRTSSEV